MEAEWTRIKLRKHESNVVPSGTWRPAKKGFIWKELLRMLRHNSLPILSGIQKQIKCQEKV
jgi:hypothetical protein